jgi:predicted O-methyltransferase YrrM
VTPAGRTMLKLMDQAVTRWHFPVIGARKARLLADVVTRRKPRRVVEVGSLFGYSAIVIAGHLPPGARLTCVEANGYLAKFVEANVKEAGLGGRVTVVTGDGRAVLPTLPGPIDIAFIDAAKEQYLDYLRALEPKLAPGAVVVADNTKMFRTAVRAYLDHVRRSGRYESREHDFGDDAMEVSKLVGGDADAPPRGPPGAAAKPPRERPASGRRRG